MDAEKILAVRLDRLGDLVLSFPALKSLRKNFPEAFISVLVQERWTKLLEENPWVNEVKVYDKNFSLRKKMSLLREIRGRGFDFAVDFQPGPNSFGAMALFFSGARTRLGYNIGLRKLAANRKINFPEKIKYEAEMALDLLRELGLEVEGKAEIKVSKEAEKEVAKLMKGLGIRKKDLVVGMHPGVRGDIPERAWKKERFTELGKRIAEELGAKVLVTGSQGEKELVEGIRNSVGEQAYAFTELNPMELAALTKRLNLYITNNSGPMHISAAVGTPLVVINAFSNNARWGPLGKEHIIIKRELPCFPCETGAPVKCPRGFECINSIQVEEVFDAVKKQLGK